MRAKGSGEQMNQSKETIPASYRYDVYTSTSVVAG